MATSNNGTSLLSRCLNFADLIRLVALAAVMYPGPPLLDYGATVVSFIGAIH